MDLQAISDELESLVDRAAYSRFEQTDGMTGKSGVSAELTTRPLELSGNHDSDPSTLAYYERRYSSGLTPESQKRWGRIYFPDGMRESIIHQLPMPAVLDLLSVPATGSPGQERSYLLSRRDTL